MFDLLATFASKAWANGEKPANQKSKSVIMGSLCPMFRQFARLTTKRTASCRRSTMLDGNV